MKTAMPLMMMRSALAVPLAVMLPGRGTSRAAAPDGRTPS